MSSTNTNIEWTDATWNPIRGCSRVSEGCRNCYAETAAKWINRLERGRGVPEGEGAYDGLLAAGGQWNGQIKLVPDALDQPFSWKKPRRIFVNSMSDLFHENVPEKFIDRVFAVMALANRHVFQILTKRPQRMQEYLNNFTFERMIESCMDSEGHSQIPRYTMQKIMHLFGKFPNSTLYPNEPLRNHWPLPNVWLGVSVEDQKTADARIPVLLQVPAAIRWVSAEPLLGPLNLTELTLPSSYNITPTTPAKINCLSLDDDDRYYQSPSKLDWVVVGGESGKDARPMHPDWVREIRDQCESAGVAFLFKQWGEWVPRGPTSWGYPVVDGVPRIRLTDAGDDGSALGAEGGNDCWMNRAGKRAAGRLLDGVLHDQYPGAQP